MEGPRLSVRQQLKLPVRSGCDINQGIGPELSLFTDRNFCVSTDLYYTPESGTKGLKMTVSSIVSKNRILFSSYIQILTWVGVRGAPVPTSRRRWGGRKEPELLRGSEFRYPHDPPDSVWLRDVLDETDLFGSSSWSRPYFTEDFSHFTRYMSGKGEPLSYVHTSDHHTTEDPVVGGGREVYPNILFHHCMKKNMATQRDSW